MSIDQPKHPLISLVEQHRILIDQEQAAGRLDPIADFARERSYRVLQQPGLEPQLVRLAPSPADFMDRNMKVWVANAREEAFPVDPSAIVGVLVEKLLSAEDRGLIARYLHPRTTPTL